VNFSKFPIISENHLSSYICSLFIKLCNDDEKKQLLFSLNNLKIKGKLSSNSPILLYINAINNSQKESSNEINDIPTNYKFVNKIIIINGNLLNFISNI